MARCLLGRRHLVLALAILTAAAILAAAGWSTIRPSHDRDWRPDQAVLPHAEFAGHLVHIRGIRNFSYITPERYAAAYYDKTFDLDKIESAWFVLSPFSRDWRGPAHSLLSFGFADSQFVAISVEARKEQGESYSVLKGLLKRFELMYVIGDERDLIELRANYRGEEVYVYPVRASRADIRRLFVEMLERANRLRDNPEFYNSVTSNCTTNIIRHVNSIAPRKVPYRLSVLLPGYADKLAYELGLLDTNLTLEQARRRYRVNGRAKRYADRPDFSIRIRGTD
jgi:hypothetical protein